MSGLAERIAASARMLGEAELVALANRGLFRRACKDLESAAPAIQGEVAGGLALSWDGQTVVLAERAGESRCTCPAGGICRHILSCLMHLGARSARGPEAPVAQAPCGAEIAALSDEEIERWAGKALWRRARRELAVGLTVACEDGAPFVGRISELNAECRWMPGAGPAGMLCSCHEPGVCLHRVVVVLAWQVARGRPAFALEDAVPEASSGAVRSRPEVCAGVATLCEDLACLGFSRTGPMHAERFRTVAMAARGVDLPRLERQVRGLAQEIDRWLARDPQASDARLLERLASCWALSRALAQPTPELVGVHRSRYQRVGTVDLAGAGAEVWQTPSGYHGLSLFFWDRSNRCWCTWSEARPMTTAGFDPAVRFAAPGPWTGAASPTAISAMCGSLMGAWRSRALRLSVRAASRWLGTHPTALADLPAPIVDWRELSRRLPGLYPIGFADPAANSDLVLVRPSRWSPPRFDAHRQVLVRNLVDCDGRLMPIIMPQSASTQAAISVVESLPDAADRCLLARLRISPHGTCLHPISMVEPAGIRSLVKAATSPTQAEAATEEADEPGDDEDADDEPAAPIGACPELERCQEACLALANAGIRCFRQWPQVTAAAAQARDLGMLSLSASVGGLAEAQGRRRAEVLLLAAWILACQRQAMQVAASQQEAASV